MTGFQREIAESIREAARYAPHRTGGLEFRAVQARPEEPSGAAGRWFVTPHAVHKFRERAGGAGRMTYEQALGVIISEADDAHFVKVLESSIQMWRGPKPRRLRYLVTCVDGPGLPVLITCLGAFDR